MIYLYLSERNYPFIFHYIYNSNPQMIETEKKIEIRAGECCAIIRQKITMATITQ